MPIVRFYIFKDSADAARRLQFACQLCARAVAEALSVWIACADEQMAQALDEQLWQYPQDAFIPHYQSTKPIEKQHLAIIRQSSHAVLSVPPERAAHTDVLINLSEAALPDIPHGCGRVFEIVTQQPSVLTATRQRFANYRERGLTPEMIYL